MSGLSKTSRRGQKPLSVDSASRRGTTRLSRRWFLGGLLASGGLTALGGAGYAWRIEPLWPEVKYHPMPLPDLGRRFQGARIIQISDLHVGPVPLDYLQKWVNWISAQHADLVVVTGHLVHYSNETGTRKVAHLLSTVRAREGILVSMGNHEWGASHPDRAHAGLAQRAANALTASGARVLRNQVATFRRGRDALNVVGLDDLWGRNYNPEAAFRDLSSAIPALVMSHNPDTFVDVLDRPFHWMLSGHTHGGQVNIPGYGPPLLPVRNRQFVAGHYELGGRNLYVNRGLGWARRVRFNARPEVTVFTLEKA